MKKILFLLIIFILVFLIYILNVDKKIYYLALGDDIAIGRTSNGNIIASYTSSLNNYLIENNYYEKDITAFINFGYRTTDLLNDIINNKKLNIDNKDIAIKHAIIKADIITVSIGQNDFLNYLDDYDLLRQNIIKLRIDMDNLLKELRSISKEPIILIGIYNSKINDLNIYKVLLELNSLYENTAKKYNITYLNIFREISNSKYIDGLYPNELGYNIISDKLLNTIEIDILK